MLRRQLVAFSLALSVLSGSALQAEQQSPLSRWIPRDTFLLLELSRPKALLDLMLDARVTAAVTSSPAYQQAKSQPGFQQLEQALRLLEIRVGSDWKTTLRKLVAGGVTLAAGPGQKTLLVVDAEDEQTLRDVHDFILSMARGEAEKKGRADRIGSWEYQGVTAWSLGPKEAHAIAGKRLFLANSREALKSALDAHARKDAEGLASLPAYQAARQAVKPGAALSAFVNLEILKMHPPIAQALTQKVNPMVALLFGPVTESLRRSGWLAVGLSVEGHKLELRATVDGKTSELSGPAAFASPADPKKGALPNLSVPRRIAGFSVYRDLHAFYAAKDDLFPERTSGLIFFENMMGIFFSGLDLTEEVLGELHPEIRLVVAEQEYDPSVGTPQMQIPAFAAIFRLRHPEKFTAVVEEAWQKAVGLTNFTRGQQAQPGLIIDKLSYKDTKFTVAYFRPPQDEEKTKTGSGIDSRFNFRPAVAALGEFLILSSTDGLVEDLIDALKKETLAPLAWTHSKMELDVVQLASILSANRGHLVRQNMVEKGNTEEQAETQIGLLITVLNYLGRARMELGSQDDRPELSFELDLNLPK